MRTLLALVLTLCTCACADVFTHVTTGEKFEGKLLGTIIEGGKRIYLVKVGRDHRKLNEADWHVSKPPPPGEDFPWKPTIYLKEVRDVAWLKRTYRSVRRQFAMARNQPVDLRLPVVENQVVLGRRVRLSGLVKSAAKDREILLLVQLDESWRDKDAVEVHVVGLDSARILPDSQWSSLAAFTELPPSWRSGPIVCTPIAKEPEPLTPQQFLALLAKNFDFAPQKAKPKPRPAGFVTCPKCKGVKTIRVMAKRISGGIYEYYKKTVPCPKCSGTGKVYQSGG